MENSPATQSPALSVLLVQDALMKPSDFQYTVEDFAAFADDRRRKASPDHLSRLYYYGMIPALGVALAIVTQSLGVAIVFTALYLSAGWAVQAQVRKSQVRAQSSEEYARLHAGPWRAELTQEGIIFSSEAKVGLFRWPFVQKVFRSANYVHVAFSPMESIHIPVRAFQSDEEAQKFIAVAQSYLKTPAS